MGKKSKAARKARRELHLPDPSAPVQHWELHNKKHSVDAEHAAFFWRDTATSDHPMRREVTCDLCYRGCVLQPGEMGWCKIRSNRGGRLQLEAHGVLGAMLKWTNDTFAIRPGARMLYLAGVSCTSGCSFCTSTDIALHPDRLPWALGVENRAAMAGEFSYHRAILHPESAIAAAQQWGLSGIYLGGNEPTLTYEWTYDVARRAKAAGLFVQMDTNAYTAPAAIEALAPFVDAVYIGIKGCGAEHFYEKYTRSPGAAEAVRAGIKAWRAAGVHVELSDVIAPPHWVDDDTFADDARTFYSWVVEELGPLTPLEVRGMLRPVKDDSSGPQLLLPRNATGLDRLRLGQRISDAAEIARACGLQYVISSPSEVVRCHACGEPLVENLDRRSAGEVVCRVTDGRCNRCREEVPIIALAASTVVNVA